MGKMILFFIDGLGIGYRDPKTNPCAYSKKNYLNTFLDAERNHPIPCQGFCKGLDATLDIPGLPQSATGQTSIFSGVNAAKELGYHLNGFPNLKLKKILMEKSILKKIKERGFKVDFINTYRPSFFEKEVDVRFTKPYHSVHTLRQASTMLRSSNSKRVSASTLTALAAEISFHSQDDLFKRKSICHDMTNEIFIEQGFQAPVFSPEEAAHILANALSIYDFILYEFFLTDFIGHAQDMNRSQMIVERIENFLESLLSSVDLLQTTVLIISDHGNFEDLSTRSHTKNPSLFMTWGRYASALVERCNTIYEPYHAILELMSKRHST